RAVHRRSDRKDPVAAEDVTELGSEEHECGHHKRVERDCGLNTLDGGVQVLDDLGDRHVHDARVERHHELGRGQEDDRDPLAHQPESFCLNVPGDPPARAPLVYSTMSWLQNSTTLPSGSVT